MRVLPAAAVAACGILLASGGALLLLPGAGLGGAPAYEPPPSAEGEPVAVEVAPGSSPGEIAEELERAGVVDSAEQFEILVSLLGYEGRLQAGDYELERGMPVLEVVRRLRDGVVTERTVTVVEGWRLEEVADAYAEHGIDRSEFLALAYARNFEREFLVFLPGTASLEGYLFPATYPVRRSDTAASVLNRMLDAFEAQVAAQLEDDATAAGLALHDVVTLASIIEREARLREERPIMAQVFLSRLERGMPLQADPTVQYALTLEDPRSVREFGYWKQGLTEEDLEVDSPYNTYLFTGLPPGPICNPGLDSIMAVLNPADTDYLYFVARPDGSHAFASTLEEHQRNVEQFQ